MKVDINNSASVVCAVVVLILALCMLRFHILQKEKFTDEGLFNNKLTKEFEENFKFRFDCSPPTFKKKMLNYFQLVKKYREQETELYDLNESLKTKYKNYRDTMDQLQESKTDLDYCVNTN